MAYNRRSGGGGGYGGYGGGGGYAGAGGYGGGGASGARYNGGGYRSGGSSSLNPWQSNSGSGGPMPRQPQQGGHPPPAQLAMASNIISKLLTSSNSMPSSGYGGGPNRSNSWVNSGPRMSHMGMRQRQDGPGGFSKDNRRRGGDSHNRFSGGRKSGGGVKDGDKRKSAGKVNDENKKGQNEREKSKDQLDADKKASYVGVPSAVLYCHVCSKHMWDCESFEKHVRGRPHELMMTYLDEAYRMRVDFMRHQIKAVENQREIDLERVTNNKHKSTSKNAGGNASKPLLRSYCPMCDVRFYGPLTGHRKSDRHRKLKQFLHPECKLCDALFHTRLEMDEHKLTAGHLKKVAEWRNVEHPHLKDDEFDLIDMIKIEEEEQDHDQMPVAKKYEMLGDRDATKLKLELEGGSSEKHLKKKDSSGTETKVAADVALNTANSAITTDGKNVGVGEGEKGGTAETEESEVMETSDTVATAEDAVTDQSMKEDTTNTESATVKDTQVVAYDPNTAIGKELLIASKGFVCRLCNCFLLDEQRVSIHCQTAAHYINYTTMTKMKEATSGGKKRGIDQVVDEEKNPIKVEENIENVVSQEAEADSEERSAKRVKLNDEKTEDTKKVVEKMDTNVEPEKKEVETTPETAVQEEPAKIAQQSELAPVPPSIPIPDLTSVPVAIPISDLPPVPPAIPIPNLAPVPVAIPITPVSLESLPPVPPAIPINPASATPVRGRGGARGRGTRGGGGTARRGARR